MTSKVEKNRKIQPRCRWCGRNGHRAETCELVQAVGTAVAAALRARPPKPFRGKRGGKGQKEKAEAKAKAACQATTNSSGEDLPIRLKGGDASAPGGAECSPPAPLQPNGAAGPAPNPTNALPREEEASASSGGQDAPATDTEMVSAPASPKATSN
ncbi:hypothetical protein MYU51_008555 [Penicillium brevicompactum]